MSSGATWIIQKDIKLSEISQEQKTNNTISLFVEARKAWDGSKALVGKCTSVLLYDLVTRVLYILPILK